MSLAVQLNQLASAHSQGLLGDDEYRLLRQSLFERFAGDGISENTEVPVIKHGSVTFRPDTVYNGRDDVVIPVKRPPSEHTVHSVTTHRSKSAISSGVTQLFRRVTRLRASTNSSSDQHPSNSQSKWKLISRVRALSAASTSTLPPVSPTSTIAHDMQTNPDSAAAIRMEIASMEAEAARLADAFDGLEMSTNPSRYEHINSSPSSSRLSRPTMPTDASFGSRGTVSQSSSPVMHANRHDSDSVSTRSKASGSTSVSALELQRSKPRPPNLSSSHSFGSAGQSSTLPGRRRAPSTILLSPISPTSSSSFSPSSVRRRPSISSVRSNTTSLIIPSSPTRSALQSDSMLSVIGDSETDEIRKRRDEVQKRYQTRITYLEAKLKSAELHEKLMRK